MDIHPDTFQRWDPIPELSDAVIAWIDIHYDTEAGLAIVARRSTDERISVRFGHPEAFKVYEEFSDTFADESSVARMGADGWNYAWPFQEVLNSTWVSRVMSRNGTLGDESYRHFVIRTFDVIVHVMSAAEPTAHLTS